MRGTEPPNHWSNQEPDGLCQFEEYGPAPGEVRRWRGPWPKDRMAQSGGSPAIPVASFHQHTSDCTVPVSEVVRPRTEGANVNPVHDPDGVCRFHGWETDEGCSVLRIPIFRRSVA